MIIRPRVYPRSHDHCVSQQEPQLRPTRTVSSTHAPGTCPHMDTWQRSRELQEYTGLAVLGVLGGGRGGMGPVGDEAVALRELLVLDAVLEEVGVGRVDVAVVRVRLQRTLCVCVCVCMYVCMYVYIYIYIDTYIDR